MDLGHFLVLGNLTYDVYISSDLSVIFLGLSKMRTKGW